MNRYFPACKHSSLLYGLAATIFLLSVSPVQAQMFSVDNDDRRGYGQPATAIFAGLEPIDFSYDGEEGVTGGGAYGFSGNILRLRLETFGAHIYLGTGVSLDDAGYFDTGIRYGFGLPLHRSPSFSVQLPIILQSTYTSVTNDQVVIANPGRFQHGTFEIGGGLAVSARPSQQFRFTLRAIPSYGFSFATRQQDSNGSIVAAKGESRFYLDYLFGSAGLVLGYDYNGRRFDNEGELLDYTSSAHSLLIGITF